LNLQFDALVAGAKFGGDFFQKGFRRGLQSQRNAALDLRVRAAEQFCERHVLLLCFGVPKGVLDSRARISWPRIAAKIWSDFRGATEVFAENQRGEKSANDKPGGFRSLRIEERTSAVVTSAQPVNAVGEKFDEDDGALASDAKLVSKGVLRRILSLRRVTASMCMDS